MKRTKFLLAASLFCCTVFAQAVKTDYSGTWKLNNGKSTQDGAADRVYTNVIEMSGSNIKVTTKADGVTNPLDGTFPMNGKAHVVKIEHGYRYTKVGWESGTLIFEITDKVSKKELARVTRYLRESWTMSPDGKVMTKFRRTSEVGKVIDQKYVFDKQ